LTPEPAAGPIATGPARSSRRPGLEYLAGPFYFVCLLLILIPLVDLATNVWPLRFGDMGWRYGTVGLLSGFLVSPLMGLVLAVSAAAYMGHTRMLKTLGVLSALGVLILLGATGLFTLDALQIRAQVPPEGQSSYRVGAARAWVKNTLVAAGMLWLAIGSFRVARSGA
jgi:hypothetical protein